MDARAEQVQPHKGKVTGRVLRLLNQGSDAPVVVQHGHSELAWIRNLLQQNQRLSLAALEPVDNVLNASLDQIVTQEHQERILAKKRARGPNSVGQPARSVLKDVGRPNPPALAGPDRIPDRLPGLRGDDDAHLGDPRRGDLLEAKVNDRLVGDRNQLLRARVGERPKPCPSSATEDEPFQRLHVPS